MISRKLMIEVLNNDNIKLVIGINEHNEIKYIMDNNDIEYINVYELAHKCKEWASFLRYEIHSSTDRDYFTEGTSFGKYVYQVDEHSTGVAIVNLRLFLDEYGRPYQRSHFEFMIEADSEPEAVFQACEWILNNKDNEELQDD